MPVDDRDKQFERALARHLRSGEPDAACPDPETLAAYHERTLSLEEMARWKEHIAACGRCQEALALVEQSETVLADEWEGERDLVGANVVRAVGAERRASSAAAPAQEVAAGALSKAKTTEIRKAGKLSKWTVPIGAIAATLLVWIGWHELRVTPENTATSSASVQVMENRETPPADRFKQLQERASDATAEDKADAPKVSQGAKAPGKDAKTQQRTGMGTGIVGGTAGGAFSGKRVLPEGRAAANPAARQDNRNDESDQLSANAAPAAPPPPASAPHAAESGRGATSSAAEKAAVKGATGGPMINNQSNQQGNQQAAQNANATLKKDEAQKQKEAAASVEVSAMTMDATVKKLPMSLRDMANITPSVIVAPDNKNAWRVGASGKIEHSGNAGNSWKPQTSGATQDLLAGMAVSKKICWIVGKSGTILLTTDGGKRWRRILSPIRGDLGGVHALDELHVSVWDVANREGYETSDGGATWKSTANE